MSNIDLTVIFLCIVGASLSSTMIYEVMNEMSPLINENDLHVSQVKSHCQATQVHSVSGITYINLKVFLSFWYLHLWSNCYIKVYVNRR